MRVGKLAILLAIILFTWVGTDNLTQAQNKKTLIVFAAASLTDAFTEIKTAFEADHPDVEIAYSFGASSTLAAQLKEGAPADVFASASASQMKVAIEAGRIAGEPQTFVKNRLVLVVPSDNPAQITSLDDLAKAGIKLVVAAPNVPVREYTDVMLDKLAKSPDYGEPYKQAVIANIASEEDNVRQVAAKVALGEADAGIVYRSDVTPDISNKVQMLLITDKVNTIATYPIAVINDSAQMEQAEAFIAYVLSEKGQAVLAKWNFIPATPPLFDGEILEF